MEWGGVGGTGGRDSDGVAMRGGKEWGGGGVTAGVGMAVVVAVQVGMGAVEGDEPQKVPPHKPSRARFPLLGEFQPQESSAVPAFSPDVAPWGEICHEFGVLSAYPTVGVTSPNSNPGGWVEAVPAGAKPGAFLGADSWALPPRPWPPLPPPLPPPVLDPATALGMLGHVLS